ncbi:class I SAM-dependent methyltransferase [Candidatus Kuenenbacteria bacterium]|nr:class I SAM-dependent methyltransferase [Candidatus Kuenenbacteria bacterium]
MNKWDKIFQNNPKYKPLNELFLSKLLQKIQTEINPSPKTIIDLGCGISETVIQFAQKGFNVTGIDFSHVALEKLQHKIDVCKLKNITLIHADLNDYKIKLEPDIILCNLVYTFIDNKEFFLKNVSDCMKKNSVFILITPVKHKGVKYTVVDKPGIAVGFDETLKKVKSFFSSVNIYHHDYIGFREDYVTFLVKK